MVPGQVRTAPTGPGRPRRTPRRPQDGPRWSQNGTAQDSSGTAPRLPQSLPKAASPRPPLCHKLPKRFPRGLSQPPQRPPNSPFGGRGGAPRSAGSKLMAICYLWKQNVRWIIDHHRVRERHALGNLMLHDFTYGFACNRKLQTNYTELPTGTIRCMLEIYHAKARSIWKAFKPLPQAQRVELRAPSPLIPAC